MSCDGGLEGGSKGEETGVFKWCCGADGEKIREKKEGRGLEFPLEGKSKTKGKPPAQNSFASASPRVQRRKPPSPGVLCPSAATFARSLDTILHRCQIDFEGLPPGFILSANGGPIVAGFSNFDVHDDGRPWVNGIITGVYRTRQSVLFGLTACSIFTFVSETDTSWSEDRQRWHDMRLAVGGRGRAPGER